MRLIPVKIVIKQGIYRKDKPVLALRLQDAKNWNPWQ